MNAQVFENQFSPRHPFFGENGLRSPKRAADFGGMVADISARYRAAMGTGGLMAGLAALSEKQQPEYTRG